MWLRGLSKFLLVALIAIGAASAAQAYNRYYDAGAVDYACPPDDGRGAECIRPGTTDGGEFTATCALVALLTGILGFVLGRASVATPKVPTRSDTDAAIDAKATDRIDEARRSVPAAVPLLEQLRDQAKAAVRALL